MQRQILNDKVIYQHIPKFFTIANNKIEVILKDDITIGEGEEMETRYGQWNEVLCTIEIAKGIRINGDEEITPVSLEQILNTFEHELAHCWEFFNGYPYDEQRVQLMANFRREFESSKIMQK